MKNETVAAYRLLLRKMITGELVSNEDGSNYPCTFDRWT